MSLKVGYSSVKSAYKSFGVSKQSVGWKITKDKYNRYTIQKNWIEYHGQINVTKKLKKWLE